MTEHVAFELIYQSKYKKLRLRVPLVPIIAEDLKEGFLEKEVKTE